jgi:hypothetical protein
LHGSPKERDVSSRKARREPHSGGGAPVEEWVDIQRGVDYPNLIADREVRPDYLPVRQDDGSFGCDVQLRVSASALRRLGLHPDQAGPARPGS